jgi:Domain of unknown function (DUF1992)
MPDARHEKRLAKRVDADGNVQFAPNWDTLIERQIREAMERGQFDELPHRGQPLPNDENPYAGDMAVGFHVLKNAGVAPPWVEANKEVNELLAKRDAILKRAASGSGPSVFALKRDRDALADLVVRANRAISKVNAEAPTVTAHRRPLDLEEELSRYESACAR